MQSARDKSIASSLVMLLPLRSIHWRHRFSGSALAKATAVTSEKRLFARCKFMQPLEAAFAASALRQHNPAEALVCYALVSEVNACQHVQLSPALTLWRLAIATRARRPGCPSSFKLIASQANFNSSFLTATPAIKLSPYCFLPCVVCFSEMTCGDD